MVLLLIQCAERSRRQSREIVLRQIIRHGNLFYNGASKLLPLLIRELLELAKNLGDCLCHVLNIHRRKELRKQPTVAGTFYGQAVLQRRVLA